MNTDVDALRALIGRAISDPGATEGYKGERCLTEWQTDAVMRALGPSLLDRIADLEAALEPFANWGEHVDHESYGDLTEEMMILGSSRARDSHRVTITVADLRRARLALNPEVR